MLLLTLPLGVHLHLSRQDSPVPETVSPACGAANIHIREVSGFLYLFLFTCPPDEP